MFCYFLPKVALHRLWCTFSRNLIWIKMFIRCEPWIAVVMFMEYLFFYLQKLCNVFQIEKNHNMWGEFSSRKENATKKICWRLYFSWKRSLMNIIKEELCVIRDEYVLLLLIAICEELEQKELLKNIQRHFYDWITK